METSQPLATESFSYSWLTSKTPSFDGLDEPFGPSLDSSAEAIPKDTNYNDEIFNFEISMSKSSASLVHADEIFSNGYIIPKYVNHSSKQVFDSSTSFSEIPISSLSSITVCPAYGNYWHFLWKWRKSSKRILHKCFGLLGPVRQKVECSRKSIRVDDIDRKKLEVQSWSNSLQASPRKSTFCSAGDWSDIKKLSKRIDVYKSLIKVKGLSNSPHESPLQNPSYSNVLCDIESSICEAVLHCKRSIEK